MRTRSLTLLFLAGALVAPAGLLAQVAGLPLRNAGFTRGLTLAADMGFPNEVSGLGTTFAASGALGSGLFGVGATVAGAKRDHRDLGLAIAVTLNLRLIGGPLVPFSATLQGGAGWWRAEMGGDISGESSTLTTKTGGLGLAWTIASPVVSLKPWLAPRLQWTQFGRGTPSSTDPAISGGIDLGFINGISVRGMYDRVFADGDDSSVWSVGLGYSLRILR